LRAKIVECYVMFVRRNTAGSKNI